MPQVTTARAVSNERGAEEVEVEVENGANDDDGGDTQRGASAERLPRAAAACSSCERARRDGDMTIEMRIRREVSSCEGS